MKDNFSVQSGEYAKYRPAYPAALFEFMDGIVPSKEKAWDCGTGNGQVAGALAQIFDQVFATDISHSQIDNAVRRHNITYSLQPAESTDFSDRMFDLVVVAQAIHWFDFEKFYAEVTRTAKEHALIFVVGYGMLTVSQPVDNIIAHFYEHVIGQYWDKERKYVDENYATIPFPFAEIPAPRFANTVHWTREHLIGYLNTWSAVQHFIRQNGSNPVDELDTELKQHWAEGQTKEVQFPLLLRVGKIKG
jgi:ubiquinone/menaquinone biosynthesis C-methylase UbiE